MLNLALVTVFSSSYMILTMNCIGVFTLITDQLEYSFKMLCLKFDFINVLFFKLFNANCMHKIIHSYISINFPLIYKFSVS